MSHANPYRLIPSLDQLLQSERCSPLLERWSWDQVVQALREASQDLRTEWSEHPPIAITSEQIRERLVSSAEILLEQRHSPSLVPVINATGVVLHTNLGRAPLAASALARIAETCGGYCNVELNLKTGQRGSRHDHVSGLVSQLCGCESAIVVNNCAAAMMLIVDEFARGREVVVSRGELVEIGGAFRVPDVLSRGGATLIEVGTTNRTRIGDFAKAISSQTSMFLSTHLSNFVQSGFVESPPPTDLVALGQQHQILSCLDLGSGLMEHSALLPEISVRQAVKDGFDLIAFSGDKLLGGPQAGLILGRKNLIDRLKKNPLMRALRVDKLILAALEGTLLHYLDSSASLRHIPTLEMLHRPLSLLQELATSLCEELQSSLDEGLVRFELAQAHSSTGGGSLPGFELPTWVVVAHTSSSEEAWATALRRARAPLLVRRSGGTLLLDVRTLQPSDFTRIKQSFLEAAKSIA